MHGWRKRVAAFALAAAVGPAARAKVTVVESDAAKVELELRSMLWLSSAQAPVEDGERVDDILLRRLRAVVSVKARDGLGLYLQVGQDNVGSSTLSEDSGIKIKDAYGTWKVREEAQIVVGQFKVPFLRHNLESGFNQLFVDRVAISGLRPAKEGSRDLGLQFWGNHKGLQYRAALFDGSDQTTDRGGWRWTGRVAYNFFTPETGLGYTGTWIGEKRVLQLAAQGDFQNGRTDPRDDKDHATLERDYRALALEAFYDQPIGKRFALTAEGAWVARNDDYAEPGTPERDIDGYYIQAGLLLPPFCKNHRLQVNLRHEASESERGEDESDLDATALGFTLFLKGHDRKLQADYTWRDEEPAEKRDDQFRLSLVFVI